MDYVKSKQIKFLFPGWSKQYREGKLKELTCQNEVEKNDDVGEDESDVEDESLLVNEEV